MTEPLANQPESEPKAPPKTASPPMSSPVARIHRLQRIFGRLEEGATYSAIGGEEGVSGERVRQIVQAAMGKGDGRLAPVHRQMQLARLMPALRLARKNVAAGHLNAIRPMLAILDRLDRQVSERSRHVDPVIDPKSAGPESDARLSGLDGSGRFEECEAMMDRNADCGRLDEPWGQNEKPQGGEQGRGRPF